MCGIAGQVCADPAEGADPAILRAMCDAMVHRGPDDAGYYTEGPVGLGMRRLKVIDLEGGHQPMSNEDGDIRLVFNGEIYNFRPLRSELERKGHHFRTNCDTEVIVHLYEERGLDCFRQLRGMFAIAVWDQRRRRLVLARDRLGKKPLYYARHERGLSFASELGALLRDGAVERRLDHQAIDEYLTFLFIPHPRTPFRDVCKLPPASYAVLEGGQLRVERYWTVQYGGDALRHLDEVAAADQLDRLLQEAVELRLVADVPVGAFLSGGLDSSLVVALMQRKAGGRVRTFCVGFGDSSFDEIAQARRVARALGTRHEELTASYDVIETLPKLVEHFGEPFADASALPTFRLCQMARRDATVVLSGDGGDEVFGGYRRYQARRWADLYNLIPPAGRGLLDRMGGGLREPAVYLGASHRKRLKRFLEYAAAVRQRPLASWEFFFSQAEKSSLYTEDFADILNSAKSGESYQTYEFGRRCGGSQGMLWYDLMTYLPDDILVKVDRMSMACSLEVRSPLLDHAVVEFMGQLPVKQKFTITQTKRLLRRVARRYLPDWVVDRRKHGFAVPVAGWLQGGLRPWMDDLLLGRGVASSRLLRRDRVLSMVHTHVEGRRDLSQQLWALIVLELWFRQLRIAP